MKLQELNKLRDKIIKDNITPELRSGAKNLVFGSGNINADIVLIGEAPGKNEDIQGKPFVGASGKFLNEMLEQNGLKREDIYITNIVKYRPPNNRDPSVEEKRAFWGILMEQLCIIKPKVIMTLGRHSGECFIPNLRISVDHGKAKKINIKGTTLLVIPLYHPAAALYNGGLRETLMLDFSSACNMAKLNLDK